MPEKYRQTSVIQFAIINSDVILTSLARTVSVLSFFCWRD